MKKTRFQFGVRRLIVLTVVVAIIMAAAIRLEAPTFFRALVIGYFAVLCVWVVMRWPAVELARRRRYLAERRDQLEQVVSAARQQTSETIPTGATIAHASIAELEQAIARDPSTLENYLKLADLLGNTARFAEAERILTSALAVSGSDLAVLERLENVCLDHARHQLAIAESKMQVEPSETARTLVQQLQDELIRLEIGVWSKRNERFPHDRQVRYCLGISLKQAKIFSEAAKCFADTSVEPALAARSHLEMGECQQHLRQFPQALQSYLQAIETVGNDLERRKLALFRAGVLAAGLDQRELAEEKLGELVDIDAQYKDAADRLDKLRSIRHKG